MRHKRNVCYVVSNELVKYSSLLPSNRNRSLLVHSLVKSYGLLDQSRSDENTCMQVLRPKPADYKELAAYHSRDYLESVLGSATQTPSDHSTPDSSEHGLEEDCPPFAGLPEYVRLVAGASLAGAQALRDGNADVAICWDGGRHHAQKSRASGFCYVADCILAILALKRVKSPEMRKPRIMYLDLDLHFSDAVSHAFASSSNTNSISQVLTLSIHHAAPGFFPASALASLPDLSDVDTDLFTLSLPLARGASDATFGRIWSCVEQIKDAFQPDFAIVQCGVDGLAGDPHAIWNWSLGHSEGSLGWCINRVIHQWDCKTLLLGGGGYHSANAARAWTYLTSIATGCPLSLDSNIPDHFAFPQYEPSFALDVAPGNAQDQNSADYLQGICDLFGQISSLIRDRLGSTED